MNFVDIIIILILLLVVGLIVFSLIKNKNNPCYNCPYCKGCDKSKCKK